MNKHSTVLYPLSNVNVYVPTCSSWSRSSLSLVSEPQRVHLMKSIQNTQGTHTYSYIKHHQPNNGKLLGYTT